MVRRPFLLEPRTVAWAASRARICKDGAWKTFSLASTFPNIASTSPCGQPRATQRRQLRTPDDEAALTADIVRLATRYGRYGYPRIREMLVAEGWRVNVKRVYRIWRREGLKVPMKQPKRGPPLAQRWIVRASQT